MDHVCGHSLSRPYFWIVISEYNVANAGVGLTWDLTCRSSPFTACYKVLCFSCNLSVASTIQSYQLLCTKLPATIYQATSNVSTLLAEPATKPSNCLRCPKVTSTFFFVKSKESNIRNENWNLDSKPGKSMKTIKIYTLFSLLGIVRHGIDWFNVYLSLNLCHWILVKTPIWYYSCIF